ncbi:hypothetical protein E4T43_08218 [Aureobasidium subglaciale]|nr:hypothetical protein E4T43_08218 [Aureobasidium subglaciale]
MVKSNKFDYTGRTSSGPKLGKSIASDLEKRADKKQREALKLNAPPARLHFKLAASTSRLPKKDRLKIKDRDRDDCDNDLKEVPIHKLDLKVPSKALTDDGFAHLADGLQNALRTCRDLALVDLNLTHNELTTRSLARLAPIIWASCYTLQTLDLSGNNFRVSTALEVEQWQLFLQSFRCCMTLRRLDLSDNPSLGSRAFEVLARVYAREPPVEPLPAMGNQSFITLPDSCSILSHSSYDGNLITNIEDPDLPRCANGKTLADTWILKYRCGLRSIPYLTLRNVGLDDTGALFLSNVLEQHYYPIQLVTEHNATEATSSIATYRQDANTKGVNWDNNVKSLSKDGLHLLQCAEKSRMKMLLGDSDSITSSYISASVPDANDASSPRRISTASLRRPSLRSIHSTEYSIYDKSDTNSARRKVQRNTIVHTGCESVDLWRASLAVIIASRKVFLLAPVFERYKAVKSEPEILCEIVEPVLDGNGHVAQVDDQMIGTPDADEDHLSNSLSALSHHEDPVDFEAGVAKRSYAATLMTTSPADSMNPEPATSDCNNQASPLTNKPNTKILRTKSSSHSHFAGLEEHDSDSTQVRGDAVKRKVCSEDYVQYQEHRIAKLRAYHRGESDGYRDVSLRCHLPLTVCLQILRLYMSPIDLSLLGVDKQRKAFTWGQKRKTLRREYDWRMKDESSQLLMLLSGAECVEY